MNLNSLSKVTLFFLAGVN